MQASRTGWDATALLHSMANGDEMNGRNREILGVLFDFDGTLGDSYDAIAASVNYVRQWHGLAPLPVEQVRRHVGHGLQYLLERTVAAGSIEQNAALYRQHHPSVMRAGTRLLPGAERTLRKLKELGRKVAVCSNKPGEYTRALLDSLGIAALIDATVCPEDVANPKPAPDMLLAAVERLGLQPHQCVYVGDMALDIEAGRKAGLPVWIIPTGSDPREKLQAAGPDRIIESLEQILHFLLV